MRLHQLKVDYDASRTAADAGGDERGVELRLALTRRFVKLLWPLLVKLAEEASPRIRTQATPRRARRCSGLEHEHAVRRRISPSPTTRAQATRRWRAPLLLARIQTGHDRNGQPVVALHPAQGRASRCRFDSVLLHSVCRLLQAAVKKSDWDMELKLPGTEARGASSVRRRTLN
jgi:hypothetical protein